MLDLGAAIGRQHAHDVVYDAAQAAFVEGRPFSDLLAADPRVTAHLDTKAIGKLFDPTAYTGLCADMARESATRAREAAADVGGFDRTDERSRAETQGDTPWQAPEIIGSILVRPTLAPLCMVLRGRRAIEYVLDGDAAARTGDLCHPSLRQDAGAAPWRCRALRIQGHRHLSRSQLPALFVFPSDPHLAALTDAMGLARQHRRWTAPSSGHISLPISPPRPPMDRLTVKAIDAVMPTVHEQLGVLDKAVARTGYLVWRAYSPSPTSICCFDPLSSSGKRPEGAAALAATTPPGPLLRPARGACRASCAPRRPQARPGRGKAELAHRISPSVAIAKTMICARQPAAPSACRVIECPIFYASCPSVLACLPCSR